MRRTIRFALGAAFALSFAASPAWAAWSEARTRHFIVVSDGSQKQLRELAENLERFDYLLRLETGAQDDDPGNPVRVYLVPRADIVQSLSGRKTAAGYYSASQRQAYAVVSRSEVGRFALDAQDILFHEYTHHFMLHNFPAAYPAWYVEGFAELYSEVDFRDDGAIRFGLVPMARIPSLVRMPLYPVADLFADQTRGLSRPDTARYYATAWLLTHYFRFNPKRGAEFNRYLTDLVAGKPVSLDTNFAGGAAALDKEIRAYAKGRLSYNELPPSTLPAVPVQVATLDPARDAMMPLEMRLLGDGARQDRPKLAQDVAAAAARYPQSAHAQALLAQAQQLDGKPDLALAAADSAIALDPGQALAQDVKADLLLARAHKSGVEADWKAARAQIIAANRADLEDPVPLRLYFDYYRMRGEKPTEAAFNGLVKAVGLLPQQARYRFLLAGALAQRRDYAQAARVLEPLAFSPHESDLRTAARTRHDRLLAAANGAQPPAEGDTPDTN